MSSSKKWKSTSLPASYIKHNRRWPSALKLSNYPQVPRMKPHLESTFMGVNSVEGIKAPPPRT